jgi:hypothetical protein
VGFGTYTNRIRCPAPFRNARRVATDRSTPRRPFFPRSSPTPHASATHRTDASEPCVVRSSTTNTQPASGSVATVPARGRAKSSSVRVFCTAGLLTSPVATSKLPIRHGVPCRRYASARRSTRPGFVGFVGAMRSRAWIPVIASTQAVCVPAAC